MMTFKEFCRVIFEITLNATARPNYDDDEHTIYPDIGVAIKITAIAYNRQYYINCNDWTIIRRADPYSGVQPYKFHTVQENLNSLDLCTHYNTDIYAYKSKVPDLKGHTYTEYSTEFSTPESEVEFEVLMDSCEYTAEVISVLHSILSRPEYINHRSCSLLINTRTLYRIYNEQCNQEQLYSCT